VFLGVLIRKLLELVVGYCYEVTVGDAHDDVLVVVAQDQASVGLFPFRVCQLYPAKGLCVPNNQGHVNVAMPLTIVEEP